MILKLVRSKAILIKKSVLPLLSSSAVRSNNLVLRWQRGARGGNSLCVYREEEERREKRRFSYRGCFLGGAGKLDEKSMCCCCVHILSLSVRCFKQKIRVDLHFDYGGVRMSVSVYTQHRTTVKLKWGVK